MKANPVRNSESKPGPATTEGKARALSNLKPWKAGQSGNPAGRTTYGATVREWINVLGDASRCELQTLIDDEGELSAKVAAARQVLKASEGDGVAFDRCADRTDGRPTHSIAVRYEPPNDPATALARLRAELVCGRSVEPSAIDGSQSGGHSIPIIRLAPS